MLTCTGVLLQSTKLVECFRTTMASSINLIYFSYYKSNKADFFLFDVSLCGREVDHICEEYENEEEERTADYN